MGIKDVIYQKGVDFHEDKRRVIVGLFSDLFKRPLEVEQVRTILVREDCVLGNHYRDYGEVYSVIGEAEFNLEDVDTMECATYNLKTGDCLFVPKNVAMTVKAKKETVIISCSESEKREEGTHAYEVGKND